MYYINCFWFYSCLGFILEHILFLIFGHKGDSGILLGPWTYIYGFAYLVINEIYKFVDRRKFKLFLRTVVLFIFCFIILSIFELIGGILIEKIFDIVWWDYSKEKFHIGKFICLKVSLFWGLLSIITLYFVKPIIDKIIKKIPKWLGILIISIMLIDFIVSILIHIVNK